MADQESDACTQVDAVAVFLRAFQDTEGPRLGLRYINEIESTYSKSTGTGNLRHPMRPNLVILSSGPTTLVKVPVRISVSASIPAGRSE